MLAYIVFAMALYSIISISSLKRELGKHTNASSASTKKIKTNRTHSEMYGELVDLLHFCEFEPNVELKLLDATQNEIENITNGKYNSRIGLYKISDSLFKPLVKKDDVWYLRIGESPYYVAYFSTFDMVKDLKTRDLS